MSSGDMTSSGMRLNELLAQARLSPLDQTTGARFDAYLALILKWNRRINLTAIRDEEGILSRHFVESIAAARALPDGIATVLDFGSGAGFPGLPIALCRSEIMVTLAESQGRKAAFLREAARVLEVDVAVHAGRAETIVERFDVVVLRAVDRMAEAVADAGRLIRPGGWLALMTTGAQFGAILEAADREASGQGMSWDAGIRLPFSQDRILALGKRTGS
jgi:16S rRNA (guanine527-N7)-methyltransferase